MKNQRASRILAINCGSSSVKCAVYRIGTAETRISVGRIDRIGRKDSRFTAKNEAGAVAVDQEGDFPDHISAIQAYLTWMKKHGGAQPPDAIGHRLVHGGVKYTQPQFISSEMFKELEKLIPLDPEHLPQEIKAIRVLQEMYPDAMHVVCFDTAFHQKMPTVARLYPLTQTLFSEGVQRFGFHGISCEFILQELAREAGSKAARGRVVIAHLGNGASMTAIRNGESIDTTMGLTPAAGLMMSTRCGDIDPGLLLHLIQEMRFSPEAVHRIINHQSGLLGISGTSSDIRDLLETEKSDPRAAASIELFCYIARKFLGALTAALGGLDTLVFTAGIGENSPTIRERICENLEFLGIRLDQKLNENNDPIISTTDSSVETRVMRTDEELMIARMVARIQNKTPARESPHGPERMPS